MTAEVQELVLLAARLREARSVVETRRATLARHALGWWEGPAADRYRERVDRQRAVLGRVADELGWLEESVLVLAAAAPR